MNRNEEYAALLRELESTPALLDTAVERALARKKHRRKAVRFFGIPAGSLAACFVGFMLLVNLFPPFAYACGQIPALKALAQAVAWSPSLSAAVENEYVQAVEERQTQNGITATVHYVIVDRKQVNIFYSLDYDEAQFSSVLARYDFGELDDWCGTSGSGMLQPGELQRIDLDFVEQDVPSAIDLGIAVRVQQVTGEPSPAASTQIFEEDWQITEETVADFDYHLEFDPSYTEQGETIQVNRDFQLDGQQLTLSKVDLYPTHLRIYLEDDPENSSWLHSLELYVENERGEQFRKTVNGITASGDPDGEGMAVFWLDSPYFRNSQHLTLYLQSADWKDKDATPVQVDLAQNTCQGLPSVMRFGGAERQGGNWVLRFIHPYKEGKMMYSGFENSFRDEDGHRYEIHQVAHEFGYYDPETKQIIEEDASFTESFPLKGFDGTVVYLEPSYHRTTRFDPPVAIPIR